VLWSSGPAVLLDTSLPPPGAHYQPVTSQPPPQTILGTCLQLLISVPSLRVYYFLSLTLSVCLSICHKHCFFFVFRWNRAMFWPSVLHDKNYKTVFFDFWFRPPNTHDLLPQIFVCVSLSRYSLWVRDPVAYRLVTVLFVCTAMLFSFIF